jgi:hypothetical protein
MSSMDGSATDRSARENLRQALVCSLVGPLVHKLSNTLLAVSGLAELAARRPSAASNGDNLRLVTEESQHAVALLRCLAELARPAGELPLPQDLAPRLVGLADLLRPWLHERQLELELRLPASLAGHWPERAVEQALLLALCGPWLEQRGEAVGRSRRRARLSVRQRRGQSWLCLALSLPPQASAAPQDLRDHGAEPDARGYSPLRRRDLRAPQGAWRALAWPLGPADSGVPAAAAPSASAQRPDALESPLAPAPAASAPTPPPAPMPAPKAAPPRRARLLLVGGPDSELTAEVLAEAGHQVERAGSLAEARRSLGRQVPEALLIEDFAGAPGYEWLRLSGEAQAIHGTRIGQLGAGVGLPAPRLPAPVRPAELLAFVERLLTPRTVSGGQPEPPAWHPFDPPPPARPGPGRWEPPEGP